MNMNFSYIAPFAVVSLICSHGAPSSLSLSMSLSLSLSHALYPHSPMCRQ